MEIFKSFSFDAAHHMPGFPQGHSYGRLHGHSYDVDVHVRGSDTGTNAWVMDIQALDDAVSPVIARIDHTYLNEIEGLEHPTCETIARWLWQKLEPGLPGLCKIVIRRGRAGGCIYRGEDQSRS